MTFAAADRTVASSSGSSHQALARTQSQLYAAHRSFVLAEGEVDRMHFAEEPEEQRVDVRAEEGPRNSHLGPFEGLLGVLVQCFEAFAGHRSSAAA